MGDRTGRLKVNAFDAFVLLGAAVNVVVIVLLVGYWLFNR